MITQHHTSLDWRIEVEEHTTGVAILEGTFGSAIDRGNADLLLRNILGHREHDLRLADALDGAARQCEVVAEIHGHREFGIVEEVVTDDGHFLTRLSPLVRHRCHYGSRDNNAEVVSYGIVAVCGEIDLIRHRSGNAVRYRHNQGIVRHVAGIQHGLLIVEQQSRHAPQVLTDDADSRLH